MRFNPHAFKRAETEIANGADAVSAPSESVAQSSVVSLSPSTAAFIAA